MSSVFAQCGQKAIFDWLSFLAQTLLCEVVTEVYTCSEDRVMWGHETRNAGSLQEAGKARK